MKELRDIKTIKTSAILAEVRPSFAASRMLGVRHIIKISGAHFTAADSLFSPEHPNFFLRQKRAANLERVSKISISIILRLPRF